MNRFRTLVTMLVAAALSLVLAAGPAFAGGGAALATEATTEEGGEGAGTEGSEEGHTKVELPSNPHDQVGLILLGLSGLAALAALANARNQLAGRRDQATGEWRWR